MKKITISPEDLKRLIKEEASKILKKEANKIIDAGDTMDVDMNQMDRVDNSDGSAYIKSTGSGQFEKKKSNMSNEEIPTDVKMNQKDKDQGHDEEIAAAVKVSAGSTKKGTSENPYVEGVKNGDFDSKKGNQSTKSSTPFEDRKEKVQMNSEDKNTDDVGAKTYVEAGGDITGKEKHTTGQKKAVSNEKAPGSKETQERIAKGIELPEGFKSKRELIDFINENARKISKLL